MHHPIAKLTKMVSNLAREAYENGYLRYEFSGKSAHGSFRSVRIEDDVVIKFARYDHYSGHNKSEWIVWHRMTEDAKRVTAKPLCISNCGRVMAMERVSKTLYSDCDNRPDYRNDLQKFNENLKALLADSGFSQDEIINLVSDNHANNVGVRENGDLCWIDFASWGDMAKDEDEDE